MFIRSFFQKSGYIILTCAILMGQLVTLGFIPAQAADYAQAEAPPESQPPEQEVDLSREAADFAWQTETIDANPGAGVFASLALDGSDHPHVSYSIGSAPTLGLHYASFDGSTWDIKTPDKSTNVGGYNALALDDNNRPHISYYDVDNTALKYSHYDGSTWAVVEVDNSGVVGGFTDIAFNPADRKVHVSYTDLLNQTLKYAIKDGLNWTTDVVEDTVNVGVGTSLILSRGNPRISYHNATDDTLRLATLPTSGTWTNADINRDDLGGEFSGFAIASDGYEHISYAKNRNHVRYSYRDAGGWHDEEVATATDDVISTALALDSSNTPAIIFAGQNGLRIAFIGEHGWMVEDIFDGPIYENSIDFAVDSQDIPHIIYANGSGLHHAWFGPTPDLRITDIWEMEGKVYAQVNNVGYGKAPAGHVLNVTVNGARFDSVVIPEYLEPRGRFNAEFDFRPACSGTTQTITAYADWDDTVIESNEDNNTRQELWKCDTIPPQILTGPEVTSLGTDAVTIAWTTDEASNSKVYYLSTGGDAFEEAYDATLTTTHTVTLTGLTPATTYSYKVESTDASGNTTTSGKHFFETALVIVEYPDFELQVTRREGKNIIYDISAVFDTTRSAGREITKNISHVIFTVNENEINRSYSHISLYSGGDQIVYTTSLNPSLEFSDLDSFRNNAHIIKATVVYKDKYEENIEYTLDPPWEDRPVHVLLFQPDFGQTFYTDFTGQLPAGTIIPIVAEAYQLEWDCEWIVTGKLLDAVPNCSDVIQPVERVSFYYDGDYIGQSTSPEPGSNFYAFNFDASGLETGQHIIKAIANSTDTPTVNKEDEIFINVVNNADQNQIILSGQRTVTRLGHIFNVELEIFNHSYSASSIWLDHFEDYAREFIPVPIVTDTYSVTMDQYPLCSGGVCHTSKVKIDFHGDGVEIPKGGSFKIEYQVVPILYETGQILPRIGGANSKAIFHRPGYAHYPENQLVQALWESNTQFVNAVGESDYIIVTNPGRLLDLNPHNDVYELLGSMATLGLIKNGVLGFVDTYDTATLDQLLEPGGYFAEALHPIFSAPGNDGYVLIVGETEIVPTFIYEYDIYETHTTVVELSDQEYSNTIGNRAPELNLGRIIGNNAAVLRIPIETSINVAAGIPGYDYQPFGRALLVAGLGHSESGQETLNNTILEISNELNNRGWNATPFLLNTVEEGQYWDQMRQKVLDIKPNLMHLYGHGDTISITAMKTDNLPLPNFGTYSPIIFASSCWTGNYNNTTTYATITNFGIAEALLQQGAAVFIGATRASLADWNTQYSKYFYNTFWQPEAGESVGKAFAQLERDKFGNSYKARFWVDEYNLYGDPKFGGVGSTSMTAASHDFSQLAVTDTLRVLVPGYEVLSLENGYDYVTIPGGELKEDVDRPQVPYMKVSIDYPPNYHVQNVNLTGKVGHIFDTGLNIPLVELVWLSGQQTIPVHSELMSMLEDDNWFPELNHDYGWFITYHTDGSSTLTINIYPFHYQPLTTNFEWYDDFTFDIDGIYTEVQIESLSLEKPSYPLGELVTGDLWLNNPTEEQNLLIVPSIRNLVSEDIILDGLTLSTLDNAEGIGHLNLVWDSSGFNPGRYSLDVEVRDTEGNLLANSSQAFELGPPSVEITAFSANPEIFEPGDSVNISLTVKNTGPKNVYGNLMIEIQSMDGSSEWASFTLTVTEEEPLPPNSTISLNEIWGTTGVSNGEYRISGYMTYNSKSTEIATRIVSTTDLPEPEDGFSVFLPLIVR